MVITLVFTLSTPQPFSSFSFLIYKQYFCPETIWAQYWMYNTCITHPCITHPHKRIPLSDFKVWKRKEVTYIYILEETPEVISLPSLPLHQEISVSLTCHSSNECYIVNSLWIPWKDKYVSLYCLQFLLSSLRTQVWTHSAARFPVKWVLKEHAPSEGWSRAPSLPLPLPLCFLYSHHIIHMCCACSVHNPQSVQNTSLMYRLNKSQNCI